MSILNYVKVFVSLMFFGSLSPTYLIELLHSCERLHHGIGSFPWVSDVKYLIMKLMSFKSIKNIGAKILTHW